MAFFRPKVTIEICCYKNLKCIFLTQIPSTKNRDQLLPWHCSNLLRPADCNRDERMNRKRWLHMVSQNITQRNMKATRRNELEDLLLWGIGEEKTSLSLKTSSDLTKSWPIFIRMTATQSQWHHLVLAKEEPVYITPSSSSRVVLNDFKHYF